MRVAILADIHGNLPALEAVVRDLSRHGIDAVVNLGDSVSGPLLPLETAQYLMAQDWLNLAGNHERQLLTQGAGQWGALQGEKDKSPPLPPLKRGLGGICPGAEACGPAFQNTRTLGYNGPDGKREGRPGP